MGNYDWRTPDTNVWKVERALLDYPHQRIRTSDARFKRLKKNTWSSGPRTTGENRSTTAAARSGPKSRRVHGIAKRSR
jgi:hypothetical protein